MTEDDKALVERLRGDKYTCRENMGCGTMEFCACGTMEDAADRIEALSAKIEALTAKNERLCEDINYLKAIGPTQPKGK